MTLTFGIPHVFGSVFGTGSTSGVVTPALWLQLRETSGTTPVNSGTLADLAITWTPGAGALGQVGVRGVNDAYLYDGAASRIVVTNNAAAADIVDTPTQRWMFLINYVPSGSNTDVLSYGLGVTEASIIISSTGRVTTTFINSTLSAVKTSDEASVVGNRWQFIFVDYDDADELGLGRIPRSFGCPVGGTVTEFGTFSSQAGTGTYTAPTSDLALASRTDGTFGVEGLVDEVRGDPGLLWTASEMQTIVNSFPSTLQLTNSASDPLTNSSSDILTVAN